MGVIRIKNNDYFHHMKRLVIQFDTYCTTGCKYCFLASLKSNPIKYNPDQLDNFLNLYKPEAITLYGADTFINFNLYKLLLEKVVRLKSLTYLSNVTELIKLERDFENIVIVYDICKKHNKFYNLTFSMDFTGKKKFLDFSNIVKLSEKIYYNEFLLNTIITIETIDEIYNNIEIIVENLNKSYLEVRNKIILKNKVTINFEAVEKPIIDMEKKVRHIFKTLEKCLIKPIIIGNENFTTFGCEARDLTGIFIDLNGDITACAKMLPEYDLKEKISALNFKEENLNSVYKNLQDFKDYNNNIIMSKCKKCKARYICTSCPKTIEKEYKEKFDKDTVLCQFYKTQYETNKELNNKWYNFYKIILRKLGLTKY